MNRLMSSLLLRWKSMWESSNLCVLHNPTAPLNSELKKANAKFGCILSEQREAEEAYREEIFRQEGTKSAIPLSVYCIGDLVNHVLAYLFLPYLGLDNCATRVNKLSQRIVDDGAALSLIRTFTSQINNTSEEVLRRDAGLAFLRSQLDKHDFYQQPGGEVDLHQMGRFIQAIQQDERHKPLQTTLADVKGLLEAQSNAEKLKLLARDGLGVCCVVCAALPPPRTIRSYDELTIGQKKVEFDVRGDLDVMDDTADMWVGVLKRYSFSYAKACADLELRLAMVEWVVRTLCPEITTFHKTGKVYLPAAEAETIKTPDTIIRGTRMVVVGL